MIRARLYRGRDGAVHGFSVKNHGVDIVCAAVSALVLNTVNCIERFTNDRFKCDYDENGGRLGFTFEADEVSHDAALLIDAMVFGLYGIQEKYGGSLAISEKQIKCKS